MQIFTAIACLFSITAILSFVNDRYLHLQPDIGVLLLAVLRACLESWPGQAGAENGAVGGSGGGSL